MQCGGVCGWRGSMGKAACQVKRSRRMEKHIFMLTKIVERKECGDLSRARSQWSVKEKRHVEQHTVSWA